jgi:hypothetical protein
VAVFIRNEGGGVRLRGLSIEGKIEASMTRKSGRSLGAISRI